MQYLDMEHTELDLAPAGDRLWKFQCQFEVTIRTTEGTLRYVIKPEFVTDFRSPGGVAGSAVDLLVSNTGPGDQGICYIIHDANYTQCDQLDGEHPVSKEFADSLLKQMLMDTGLSHCKAWLVYDAVSVFGDQAYDEPAQYGNSGLFSFHWDAK